MGFISLFFLASLSHHLFRHLFLLEDVIEDAEIHLPPPHLTTFKGQDPNLATQEFIEEWKGGDELAGKFSHSILFHDWEVFLLLPAAPSPSTAPYSCIFQDGATSPATPVGVFPSSGRSAFKCVMPTTVRRLRPFFTPTLFYSQKNYTRVKVLIPINGAKQNNNLQSTRTTPQAHANPTAHPTEMLRWNFYAYESLSTENDVILFAKGINHHTGVNRPAASLRCVFANGVKTEVTSSSQEVFRCPHPARRAPHPTRVTLEIGPINGSDTNRVVPSVAVYEPWRRSLAPEHRKSLLCACTVVYNVAKFVKEWVIYHSAIGVEKFVLYDNGSDDDLSRVVGQLVEAGHDMATFYWPWPKTQEAGFSHCATSFRDSCTWMLFADVDEFVFSPRWKASSQPSKLMLRSLLPPSTAMIGQIIIKCYDFGPSDRRSHPMEGVTQGYTCRLRVHQRHKSIALLDGVDRSLENVVHHFKVKKGYKVGKLGVLDGVVNHYKYQAWVEFKHKFKRRASAYVYDWRRSMNLASKDRAPGLGSEPIEPDGWASKFCEVNDTGLRDVGRSWFGLSGSTHESSRMAWQDE